MGTRTSPRSRRRRRLIMATITILASCPLVVAASFAPFVIPAQIDSQQTIWVDSYEQILTDSARLRADEHFQQTDGASASGASTCRSGELSYP